MAICIDLCLITVPTSIDVADTSDMTDTRPVELNDSSGVVFSYSLIIMLGCSLLAMLL